MRSSLMIPGAVALALAQGIAAAAGGEAPRQIVIEPELTEDVLINPLGGWQKLAHMRPQGEIEKMPLLSTYYYRAGWAGYQTGVDKYDGHAVRTIDSWLDYCKAKGRYFGIRVVTYNSKNPTYQRSEHSKWKGCDSAVPTCVWAAGAKGFREPGGANNWVPCFWDEVYLDEMEKLVRWMGKRWGDHPNLAFVDIGGGNWGEMNLRNTGIPSLDDLSVWRQNGLTEDAWDAMIRRLVKVYKEAFPKQHLIIAADFGSYGKGQSTIDHVINSGIGFRDDGLGMGYSRAGRKNREFMKHWKEVLCIFDNGYSDWTSPAWCGGVRGCLEWAIDECHAGIVMVGKGSGCEKAYNTHKDLVTSLGKRVGYRHEIKKAAYFSHPRKNSNFNVQLIVNNAGNVPCYFDAKLEVSLRTGSGQPVFTQLFDTNPPIRRWMPGQPVRAVAAFKIPGSCPTGKLALCVGIVDAKNPSRRIQLPLRKTAGERVYMLGTVNVRGSSTRFTGTAGGSGGARAKAGPAEGPLSQYAEKLKAPMELRGARDFAGAAGAYDELAEGADDEKAKVALKALAKAARAGEAIKAAVIEKAGKGRPVTLYVEVAGRKMRGKLSSADADGVRARVMGQEIPVKWKDLSGAALYRLGRACLPKTADGQLGLLRFAVAAELTKQSIDLSVEIRQKWPARANEVKAALSGR